MKPQHFTLWAMLASAVLATATTLIVQQVRAAGIPAKNSLTYTGYLENPDGTPVVTSKNIALAVYDAATAGTKVCEVLSAPMTPVLGRFQIALPDDCTAKVGASPDLWLEVAVDGAALGRTKLGAVPYAVEAGHAVAADSATNAVNAANATNAVGGLDTRITALETAKGTLSGNAKAGYFQPAQWSYSYLGVDGVVWRTLWSAPITIPVNSIVNASVNGHWKVDTNWCYLSIAIDGVSLADPSCDTSTTSCWGATHTYSTGWAPVGYSAMSMVAAGTHSIDVQVRPMTGTSCTVNGARLYWSVVPQ